MLLCQLPNQSIVFEKKSFLNFQTKPQQRIPNKLEANRIDGLVPSFSGRFCSALFYAYIAISAPSSGCGGGFCLFTPSILMGSSGCFSAHNSSFFTSGSHDCGGAGTYNFRMGAVGRVHRVCPNDTMGTNNMVVGTIRHGTNVKDTPWMWSPGAPVSRVHPPAPGGNPWTIGRRIHEPYTGP